MPDDFLVESPAQPTEYLTPRQAVQSPTQTEHATVPQQAAAQPANLALVQCSLSLVIALGAKSFVVLTGPSGTGKSRLALTLAQAVETLTGDGSPGHACALVPVGADWTDARNLLGYRNPFGKARETENGPTNETYDIPDALRLLLRSADPERMNIPHFLILDEMNLSHVERYFSPFLSLMEARRSAADPRSVALLSAENISLIKEVLVEDRPGAPETEAATRLDQVGDGLAIALNLFTIGTVNVDETTYMFSPKVLDRAHVIELLPVAPGAYIDGTAVSEDEFIPADKALTLITEALEFHRTTSIDRKKPAEILEQARLLFDVPPETTQAVLAGIRTLLNGAFKLLDPVGFGFGFRVVNEVCLYMFFWLHAMQRIRTETHSPYAEWQHAIDRVFLQKVLPKIHGNRRQIGGALGALSAFLQGNDKAGAPAARFQNADSDEVGIDATEKLDLGIIDQMRHSRRKVSRMRGQLAATGYVSFVQ